MKSGTTVGAATLTEPVEGGPPPEKPEPAPSDAAFKKAHELVAAEVIHEFGWPYRGESRPNGTVLMVPRYVLDGNPEFIKERE
ncbi:MAG TPA: hypothetical protein VK358_09315 [Longimicrobium sp.]|nr:hypothetical protein [Longimicrobium sp.]